MGIIGTWFSRADPVTFCAVVAVGIWYAWAGRRRLALVSRTGLRRPVSARRRWQATAFYTALALLLLALQPPIDDWATTYLWAHMIQHLILLVGVPPMLCLAAPWMRFWNTLPLSFRRTVAHAVVRSPRAAPLRAAAGFLVRPMVVWILLAATMVGWHIPPAYDATLTNAELHDFEHITYLLFGTMFWGQLIDTAPFHSRLGLPQRVIYLGSNMFVGWTVAIALAFSVTPYYAPYIRSVTLAGVISPLTDQQIAGGIMWVPGTIPFALTGFILLYHWIERERRKDQAAAVPGAGHLMPSSDPHWT